MQTIDLIPPPKKKKKKKLFLFSHYVDYSYSTLLFITKITKI